MRALPAGDELTHLPRRRGVGAQRASHRRLPQLAAGEADEMTASVPSVEMAHPVADRRRGGDELGGHLAHAFFGESVDRTRYGQRGGDHAWVVAGRGGCAVTPR